MGLTLIAALDYGLAIGKNGKLPWRLQADMRHFQETTRGKIVVMGRKTFDSLPERFRPLPDRKNWILTRDERRFSTVDCWVAKTTYPIVRRAQEEEIFVIGGGEVYKTFLPIATRILITHVETRVEGADVFFPELPKEWVQTKLLEHDQDEKNDFRFTIVEYKKPQHGGRD
jgi:dihydrofolate reductase